MREDGIAVRIASPLDDLHVSNAMYRYKQGRVCDAPADSTGEDTDSANSICPRSAALDIQPTSRNSELASYSSAYNLGLGFEAFFSLPVYPEYGLPPSVLAFSNPSVLSRLTSEADYGI